MAYLHKSCFDRNKCNIKKKRNKFGCLIIGDASKFHCNTKLRGITLVCDSVCKSLLKHLQVIGGDLTVTYVIDNMRHF
jgi:hypothetical protein